MKNEWFEKWMLEGTISIPKVLLRYYRTLGLKDEECMLLLHVYTFIESGTPFPTPEELSNRMSLSSEACIRYLRGFIQKGFLEIHEVEDKGIRSESYSLLPLWNKLSHVLMSEEAKHEMKNRQVLEESVYTSFEREFGRPLSPMECETLKIWIDQDGHDADMILTALKEAVLSGKLNFRYIDRILFEWKKNNVRTPEEARTYGERFRAKQNRTYKSKQAVTKSEHEISIPLYNWLEQ
ncbi:DnaD domain-containing protein [Fictibacillus sp. Mic-4]|uniref:DnaD domain-containing protein n=1 Tax=Fictibacillus TaxID=1329200 RepID=UPI000416E60B|nr:DnaD domain-containing protein [Fictibacillus gelatini]